MKLYNKSELRYSRIFFDKRPPAYAFILIFSTLIVLLLSFVVAAYLPKHYIVKATGSSVIRGTEYITAVSNGKIVTLHKNEGDSVKAGEVILSLSSGQEGLQTESLKKQLEKLKSKEAIFQKYEQSLNGKANYMVNSGEEQEYYGKVEYYLSQLKSENYNDGTQYAKLQDEYAKLNRLTDEKSQLDTELSSLQLELTNLEAELAGLSEQPSSEVVVTNPTDAETSSSSTETPINTTQIEKLKTRISEVKTKIETTKSSIQGKVTEIDSLRSNIKDMERSYHNPTSQAYTTYAQLISELGTARAANNKSITELEANLGVTTGQDKGYTVLAPSGGTLHYVTPFKQGMSVQQHQTIAEIAGDNKEAYIEAFVLATDISRVFKGAKVDVAITGVNSQKYGTLKGTVRQIDSGTVTRETKNGNISLYKVVIELESLTLKKGKEVIVLQKDMPVEARIVYNQETYLDWILELLSFK
ncbi:MULTISPECIES: HlyD family efflux transporter periplasmic adaptor subunit [Streptococcus]|uniref:HlyD family efflux transporter periplasmic adaptor subunit n=1 Tax=Streptococcus ruminantium TaxID=1917441 RepID=A0A2Z5TTE7_9STRE|nr:MULTISPECIES: HlyD family efflux transporter periplasmic adaptor subunit [Streptococcus]MDQ8759683.1 HlyD family efflux transporter periplasmic adaptor subunit [Streptococcus ruminantium]MDQ8765120.1 HlyD family efflux transporter periplasmic adaptor subunit [Streptococcus ruminantium]MDQ8766680.1 HlyD family efflux transporter periplasmic adaptor subunit [Streptococcus ruminantium]MDQ8769162.1 HlyD family efflux transporter periplasmic adaptor subunit [Streptococcus ruminantium]MDQ8774557.